MSRQDHLSTRFIEIDTRRCEACWECIDVCPTGVLGRIDLWVHRHIHVDYPEACNGCKRCVHACKYDAIRYTYQPIPRELRHTR